MYNAVLELVDIAKGTNSYYKLQLLEGNGKNYCLFRAWGRVGTSVGNSKVEVSTPIISTEWSVVCVLAIRPITNDCCQPYFPSTQQYAVNMIIPFGLYSTEC